WERVMPWRATRSRYWAASKCSITTLVAPSRTAPDTLASGAQGYSGAGGREGIGPGSWKTSATKGMIGRVAAGWTSGSGRRMPLGWPVVPEEYSIGVPSCSSAIGSVGKGATAASYGSYPLSGSSMSTMSHRSTSGQRAGSATATSRCAAELITTRAWQSLTMYAASPGERYELTHVY